jgi:hypothetical protein
VVLEFGSVTWVEIPDPNGVNLKKRPVIVLTRNDEIRRHSDLHVVAITGTLPDPLTDKYVLLPWHPTGRVRTGLRKKCAAVCSWLEVVPQSAVVQIAGIIPAVQLTQIVDKVNELYKTNL